MPQTPEQELTAAYHTIAKHLYRYSLRDKNERQNLVGSSGRAARALLEMMLSHDSIASEVTKIIGRVFPVNNSTDDRTPIVVHGPVPLVSMCPHHLMPVKYTCYMGYLPKHGQVLGISKLSRLSQLLAKRPLLQEQLTQDLADVLYRGDKQSDRFSALDTYGSIVYLSGQHSCQELRGVRSPAFTTSTAIRGDIQGDMELNFIEKIKLLVLESQNRR